MTTPPSRPAIESLIPHRTPMLLVERIVEVDDQGIRCQGHIASTGPFAHRQGAPIVLGLELAAQSAAIFEALRRRASAPDGEHRQAPPIGYLTSIRNARFHVPSLPADTDLWATVRRTGGVDPLALYEVALTRADDQDELLSATLSTFLQRAETAVASPASPSRPTAKRAP